MSRTVLTQFGRALKRLGIDHIAAYSPQARGRSERAFSTLQDRLPKELRLAGISTVEAANRWLSETYMADHNKLFAVDAEQEGSAFVADATEGYLVGAILPLLRRRLPDCTTYLIGSKMPDEVMNLQVPGVKPLGFVSVLADILHKLRCTVVPLRYGAGIKGKVLESFAHGLPCVMSEVAAEGLELPDDLAWLVARTPEEFANKLARVQEDEAFNRRLSEAGLAYIEQRHSAGVVREALRVAVTRRETWCAPPRAPIAR